MVIGITTTTDVMSILREAFARTSRFERRSRPHRAQYEPSLGADDLADDGDVAVDECAAVLLLVFVGEVVRELVQADFCGPMAVLR